MNAGTAVGISLGSVAATLVLIVAAVKLNPFKPEYEQGRTVGSIFDIAFFNWFNVLYHFLPYGLFLFGIIYDGLIRKIKFFPAGFVGLFAVYINSFISYFINQKTPTKDKDICGIPGMSAWGSRLAPNNIVFTSTVMSYIASYISATQSDSSYSGAAWGGVILLGIIQSIAFWINDCGSVNAPINGWVFGSFGSVFIAVALGMLFGGLTGFGVSKLSGDTAGVGLSTEQKQSLMRGTGPAMAPTTDTPGAGKCSPTDSDDAFVCEAYKNGELITSTIVE